MRIRRPFWLRPEEVPTEFEFFLCYPLDYLPKLPLKLVKLDPGITVGQWEVFRLGPWTGYAYIRIGRYVLMDEAHNSMEVM